MEKINDEIMGRWLPLAFEEMGDFLINCFRFYFFGGENKELFLGGGGGGGDFSIGGGGGLFHWGGGGALSIHYDIIMIATATCSTSTYNWCHYT